jgi:hypothetical protein
MTIGVSRVRRTHRQALQNRAAASPLAGGFDRLDRPVAEGDGIEKQILANH